MYIYKPFMYICIYKYVYISTYKYITLKPLP